MSQALDYYRGPFLAMPDSLGDTSHSFHNSRSRMVIGPGEGQISRCPQEFQQCLTRINAHTCQLFLANDSYSLQEVVWIFILQMLSFSSYCRPCLGLLDFTITFPSFCFLPLPQYVTARSRTSRCLALEKATDPDARDQVLSFVSFPVFLLGCEIALLPGAQPGPLQDFFAC